MKVADKLLRRIGVTRERKDQECAEICDMSRLRETSNISTSG